MALRTFYVALAFSRSKEGHLVAGEACPCPCAATAARRAETMRSSSIGAIAFSREIDDDTGHCSNAAVLSALGEVPRLDYLLAG